MLENLQSVCVNTAYACAVGVGAAVVVFAGARGMKFLSGVVKCLPAASLAGTLIIGGMTMSSVHVAGAKTNGTQQVGSGISNAGYMTQAGCGTKVLNGVALGRAQTPAAPQGVANGESDGHALRRSRSLRSTGTPPRHRRGHRPPLARRLGLV